ncbi:MAG: hypothetical protein U9N81_06160 [Bacillota bacterium]|nr:hypothetical protein [Bacillota bacterium]
MLVVILSPVLRFGCKRFETTAKAEGGDAKPEDPPDKGNSYDELNEQQGC